MSEQPTEFDALEAATGEVIELKPPTSSTPTPLIKSWGKRRVPEPRDWLLQGFLLRQFVSAIGATGGTGKTQFGLSMAIGMAVGQDLLGLQSKAQDANNAQLESIQRHKVIYANLEDPQDEFDRRAFAICMHHDIDPSSLDGYLFDICGRDHDLKIVTETREGPQVNEVLVDQIVRFMSEEQVDLIVIDPFVSSHGVSENSNEAQDLVVKTWCRIASRTNAAVLLVHHLRKTPSGDSIDANALRGGGAFVDAVRALWILGRMSEDTAAKFDVSEEDRGRFFSINKAGKNNLALQSTSLSWYRMDSQSLDNGTKNKSPDWLGVPKPWQTPKLTDLIDNIDQLIEIQRRISASNKQRLDGQAKDWVGHLIADVLALDTNTKTGKHQTKQILDMWISAGALKIDVRTNPHNKDKTFKYVIVGKSVEVKQS